MPIPKKPRLTQQISIDNSMVLKTRCNEQQRKCSLISISNSSGNSTISGPYQTKKHQKTDSIQKDDILDQAAQEIFSVIEFESILREWDPVKERLLFDQ
mmetsp:Transcript_37277/g.42576  ORF Transcript_37277/g.42576 Transcript_37277/m.42576 type:complete len:99 (-) Transcript_37277:71-367(-)